MIRRYLAASPLLIVLLGTAPQGSAADVLLPLFDAHLHYNDRHAPRYPPGWIASLLQENGIEAAVVTSRPPQLVLTLHALAPDLVIPLLGVYERDSSKAMWVFDSDLPGRVEQALAQGPWRGIGELHIRAPQRNEAVFLRIVELAAERRLPLLMHCDPAVIDNLFEHAPQATVIWAHAGAYPFPPLLRDYLDRYPGLFVDLSVRDDRVAPDGELDPAWELLFLEYPDRFLVGVDTYRPARWEDYSRVVKQIRSWLDQLPDEVARAIARENGARLFRTPGAAVREAGDGIDSADGRDS